MRAEGAPSERRGGGVASATLSIDEVAAVLAAAAVGDRARSTVDLGSARCAVHVLDTVVIKAIADPHSSRIDREADALALVGGRMRSPALLARGRLPDQRPWVVMSRVPGRPPADAARPAHRLSDDLAATLGGLAATLHRVARPPGFGTWRRDPRCSLLDEQRRRIDWLAGRATTAPPPLRGPAERAVRLLRQQVAVLATAPRNPVLVHRDLQPRNVLIDSSTGAAWLVDFESAAGGDPAEDFSRVALDWTTSAFRSFVTGYRSHGGDLGPGGADRVAFFTAYWAALVLVRTGHEHPEYVAPALVALDRCERGERPSLI